MIKAFINPAEGVITSSFGERENPVIGDEESHTGLDIAVAEGTEVLAVYDGTVTEVGETPAMGVYMKYKTDNEYTVLYAHLSKTKVKKGEKIKQGQMVALSGNTGRSTGPHLHYTIWDVKSGQLMDPIEFVDLPYTEDVKIEYANRGETIH